MIGRTGSPICNFLLPLGHPLLKYNRERYHKGKFFQKIISHIELPNSLSWASMHMPLPEGMLKPTPEDTYICNCGVARESW